MVYACEERGTITDGCHGYYESRRKTRQRTKKSGKKVITGLDKGFAIRKTCRVCASGIEE